MIVLGRVDFRRENALLLLLSLEVDYIRQTLSLEFADKSLAIFQQACLIKDHIIATWDEVDCWSADFLLGSRLYQVGIRGIEPEVVVSEDKLVNDWNVKFGQFSTELIHDHLADILIELGTDI